MMVQKLKRERSKRNRRRKDPYMRAAETITISGESFRNVSLLAHNIADGETVLAERLFNFSTSPADSYAAPHVLLDSKSSFLPVSNFSNKPVIIRKGQALAIKRDPSKWFDRIENTNKEDYAK